MPLIVEFLDGRPRGASLEEIAAFLDTTCDSARTSMKRLLERDQVKLDGSLCGRPTGKRRRRFSARLKRCRLCSLPRGGCDG
jgi:hypothetical protein